MVREKWEWNMPLFMEAYTNLAKNGKSKEGRVPDYTKQEKDYRAMRTRDVLRFFAANPKDFSPIHGIPEIKMKVLYIYHYDSVEDMLETEGIQNLLPSAKSKEEALKTYLGFPEYPERVRKYGVYAMILGKE